MYRLFIFILCVMTPCWGQRVESLRGLDLRVESEGRQVQFAITPEVFEQVTNYLETHSTQHFFVEDNRGARYKGTVTHMEIMLAPKHILFSGTLDQPLSSLAQDMQVYLNLH